MALTLTGAAATNEAVGAATGGGGITFVGGGQGDQNILWMAINSASTLTLKSVWNIGDQYTDTNGTSAWFWIPNLGSAASQILVDWGGSAHTWHGATYAFNGADYVPYRAFNKAHGTASPITVASLTTVNANSWIVAHEMIFSSGQVIGTPTFYTNISNFANSNGSNQTSYETRGAAGSTSDAISSTITAASWNSHGIEIAALVPSSYPYPVQQASSVVAGSATSATIPAATVSIGDVVLAFCMVNAAAQTMTVSGAGWAIVQQDTTNSLSIAIAACTATSTTVPAVTFNWSASNLFKAQSYQYRNAKGTFGSFSVNTGQSTSTASHPGVTTTSPNSLVVLWGFAGIRALLSQNPDYYVEATYSDSTWMSYSLQDTRVPIQGTATPVYSQGVITGGTFTWKVFMTELVAAPSSATLIGQTSGAI